MVRTLKTAALAGALVLMTAPAFAAILTLPFIGDIQHPDMDPLHIMGTPAPEAAPAAAPAKPMKKKHHKKMMKKKM